jgi:DNA-binding NtrC family response regulator
MVYRGISWKGGINMQHLLIADKDEETRRWVAGFFSGSEYRVIEADSVDVVLRDVLKRKARVILLGSEFDGLTAMEMIPLLKRCNRNVSIILISNEESPALIRRFRQENIFYHALKPVNGDDREEFRQVVQCAFHNSTDRRLPKKAPVSEVPPRDAPEMFFGMEFYWTPI